MKSLSISALAFTLVSSSILAQTAGGAASGAAGTTTPTAPPTAPRAPAPGQNQQAPQVAPPATPVAPVTPSQEPSATQPNSTDINATTQSNMTVEATNQFGVSNQFGFGTNQFGVTNGFGVGTNGVVGTNQFGVGTNQIGTNGLAGGLFRDQAITAADRQLLTQLRAAVFGANLPAEQAASQPIHFILANGVVRIVGEVASVEQRQQVEAAVQRTPGVVRIFDALTVSGQPTLGVNVLPGNTPPNALSPVSQPGFGGNRVFATNSPSSTAPQTAPSFPGTAPSGPTPGSTEQP